MRLNEAGPVGVVDLDAALACDPALTGGKAATLAELRRAGFPVPEGLVVTVPAMAGIPAGEPGDRPVLPDGVRRSLRALVAERPDASWAVRSSAVGEDSAVASFAGLYESYLDVRGASALEVAVVDCWRSARRSRVAGYRADVGVPDAGMAVLVQRYVAAEIAGVALGADPVTGCRDTVVVTAVRGAGASLVGGVTVPDEWAVVAGEARCRHSGAAALTAAGACAVAELLRTMQAHRHLPQDLEWAMVDGKITVLQLRPMTALPMEVSWTTPQRGGWLRTVRLGEWLPEPVTPLCDTWLLSKLEERFRRRQRAIGGFLAPAPMHVLVNGWYFHSPIGTGRQTLLFAGLLRRPRLALATLVGRRRPEWSDRLVHRRFARLWQDGLLPRYRSMVARSNRRVETAGPAELIAIVDELADLAGEYFWSLVLSGGAAWRAEEALDRFHRRRLADRVSMPSQTLLQGLSVLRPQPHAVFSLDWVHPTVGEFGSGGATDDASGRRRHAVGQRLAAEEACREALRGRARRRFDRLLAVAQRAALARQEQTHWFTLGWPTMRRAVLRLGEVLCGRDLIDDPADVFLLTKAELAVGASGAASVAFRAAVGERRREWERHRRLTPPAVIGRLPALLSRVLLSSARPSDGSMPAGTLCGVPTSPGRFTGPVRVLRDPTAIDQVGAGEVLVVSAAVPALAEVFGRIGALCVDGGSVAAHAAIVAREYGLPAVMGLIDATTRLADGLVVTVDGTAGVVEVR
jgi:pyruvate,water dikinase